MVLTKRWLSPGRFLALGFAAVILLGTILLLLPVSANPGVTIHPVDALFTSTSAVCVTGLIAIDTADHFSVFGRTVVALLIQIGGLGITSIGVTFILLARKKIGLRERVLVKEALNLDTLKGVVQLVKSVMLVTLCFEAVGMALSYIVFSQDYPPLAALGISAFHSVAAFNNSGFDILGGYQNLIPYRDNVLLNLTTCGLIIFGGLGFYVIREILHKRSLRNLSMNTKIVLTMTVSLLAIGTVLLKLTDDVTWLGAFFQSTSARTAGFSTYALGDFTAAGQFVLIILMFIGASPGSTGGGIKTTTAFTMLKSLLAFSTNRDCTAFRRKIPKESIIKAFTVTSLAAVVVCFMTLFICITEPHFTFMQVFFEVVSGFGTVGLSTGITPNLTAVSKILLCLTMFIGRLGPLTMACVWVYQPSSNLSYAEERVTIG
ncbi:TrkH family potassium uptake protein [Anaerotaenia torta]|uniref:TrkH family potassium uptake protein n=1 Tax=Anaerotaenia torta TaxID=433293 RepID=UPI003D1B5298